MNLRTTLVLIGLTLVARGSGAASSVQMHDNASPTVRSACTTSALACATAVTPYIDAKDRLWLAWVANGTVSVAHSPDGGRSFGTPVQIGQHGALLDAGADAKPQLLIDGHGRVIVAYGVFKDQKYNAQVMIATSDNDGASFSAPRSLSADSASQRFPALALGGHGDLLAVWLDKRTVAESRKLGYSQTGAALAYARSVDGGNTFGVERIAQDRSCECCRLALATDSGGNTLVVFRNIFDDRERDHAVLTISSAGVAGPSHRVAADHWAIDACPHHGPSAAIGNDGAYHVAWFTQGSARQGTFYARSVDAGRSFSTPIAVGNVHNQTGRPSLLASGQTVWLAWKEFDGERNAIWLRSSRDSGRTWSADRKLVETSGYADHPALVRNARQVFLSWMTRDEGYRLIPVATP